MPGMTAGDWAELDIYIERQWRQLSATGWWLSCSLFENARG